MTRRDSSSVRSPQNDPDGFAAARKADNLITELWKEEYKSEPDEND